MENSISCPICSSKLQFGLEEIVLHLKVIDPKTGSLLKRTHKRHLTNNDTRMYISCSECDFFADNEDEPLFGKYFHIFDLINDDDINKFSISVQG
ncbi:hypothetical protein KTH44_16020 [Acinetobacter bereziniae]|uniref:hypothetical protein n=1 Tax=Acinetobacter bereziniae TaxID=106648 RepID=UPI0021CD90FE|nr:hypothetical protein [Acinetobacter bereziniae]MCU4320624.1 hypothetical protein [Acinetobacter bereziniae]